MQGPKVHDFGQPTNLHILGREDKTLKRRMMRFEVTGDFFAMMMTEGMAAKCVKGIPSGALFRGYVIDPARNSIMIFVQHSTFDVVPEGSEVPLGEPCTFEGIIPVETEEN